MAEGKRFKAPEGKALTRNRFQNQLGAQSNKDLSNFAEQQFNPNRRESRRAQLDTIQSIVERGGISVRGKDKLIKTEVPRAQLVGAQSVIDDAKTPNEKARLQKIATGSIKDIVEELKFKGKVQQEKTFGLASDPSATVWSKLEELGTGDISVKKLNDSIMRNTKEGKIIWEKVSQQFKGLDISKLREKIGPSVQTKETKAPTARFEEFSLSQSSRLGAVFQKVDELTTAEEKLFKVREEYNIQGALGDYVGATNKLIEYAEVQKKLNQALGKGSQFADQFSIALTKAQLAMEEFPSAVADAASSRIRSNK